MKKTVLFLLNGLGIEKKGSASVYSPTLMPTMDKLTFEHIFASLPTSAFDYKEGFKHFSVGVKTHTVDTLIELAFQNQEIYKNQTIPNHLKANENGKLHIMISLESLEYVEQLKLFLSYFRKITQKPIWVHPVFFSETIHQYQYLDSYIGKIRDICDTYPNVKIGIVTGKNYVYGNQNIEAVKKLYRIFINEIGEKWTDYTNKLETLYKNNVSPKDVAPFVVHNGFKIEDHDLFFMMNHKVDTVNVMYNLFAPPSIPNYSEARKDIKIVSLFPLEDTYVEALLQYAESKISLANSCESIGAKTLILTQKNRMQDIYYYCNGLKKIGSSAVQFALFDDNHLHDEKAWELIHAAIHMEDYTYIIIDYDISEYENIEMLKEALQEIDQILLKVKEMCKNEKMSLFVSSLYGMKKTFVKEDVSLLVDFSSKVPVIVVDDKYPKNIYQLEYGTTFDLSNTILKNIDSAFIRDGLLKEKNKGFSLFGLFKKKRNKKTK